MNCLSLYSGADNLGDGVIQAGHKVKLAIEINTDACKTIKLNHPDIEVINGKVSDHLESLGKFDCIIGGPPCPEFSRAKIKDRTFDLCEVNNFKRARELTKADFWFMENVQDLGLVLKEKNYLIDCVNYGVPQFRLRRIFTNLPKPKETHSYYPSLDLFGNEIKGWVSVANALNLREGYIEDRSTTFGETEYRKYSLNRPSHTIIARSREFYVNGKTERPLTIRELATLQGFRPDFKFSGGIVAQRTQIGNSLPAAVSKAFFSVPLVTIRGKR